MQASGLTLRGMTILSCVAIRVLSSRAVGNDRPIMSYPKRCDLWNHRISRWNLESHSLDFFEVKVGFF